MTGTPDAILAPMPHETRKAVFASAIGNVLEWYDFGVYIFLAGTIAQTFFPGCTKRLVAYGAHRQLRKRRICRRRCCQVS